MSKMLMKPKPVGNRRLMRNHPRLVIVAITKTDDQAVNRLMADSGHKSGAGVVRLALRKFSQIKRGDKHAELMCIQVRREARSDMAEHGNLVDSLSAKLTANLDAEDNELLQNLLHKWELESFAQVIRLAIRVIDRRNCGE